MNINRKVIILIFRLLYWNVLLINVCRNQRLSIILVCCVICSLGKMLCLHNLVRWIIHLQVYSLSCVTFFQSFIKKPLEFYARDTNRKDFWLINRVTKKLKILWFKELLFTRHFSVSYLYFNKNICSTVKLIPAIYLQN